MRVIKTVAVPAASAGHNARKPVGTGPSGRSLGVGCALHVLFKTSPHTMQLTCEGLAIQLKNTTSRQNDYVDRGQPMLLQSN